jgi:hypothetical protein
MKAFEIRENPTGQGAASGFGQANSLVQTSLWPMIVLAKRQKFPWERKKGPNRFF